MSAKDFVAVFGAPDETTALLRNKKLKKLNNDPKEEEIKHSYRILAIVAIFIILVSILYLLFPKSFVPDLNPYYVLNSDGLRVRFKTKIAPLKVALQLNTSIINTSIETESLYLRVNMPASDLILGNT